MHLKHMDGSSTVCSTKCAIAHYVRDMRARADVDVKWAVISLGSTEAATHTLRFNFAGEGTF